MASNGESTSPASGAWPVPGAPSTSPQHRGRSLGPNSYSRATSTARLASPVHGSVGLSSPPVRQIPSSAPRSGRESEAQTPLPGVESARSLPGPGQSALAAALQDSLGRSPPRTGTPPLRPLSPTAAGAAIRDSAVHSAYGSVDARPGQASGNLEDAEIVKRHLVQPNDGHDSDNGAGHSGTHPTLRGRVSRTSLPRGSPGAAQGIHGDEFSSLQLQGGDVTRQVYRWTEEAEAQSHGRGQRRNSFHGLRPPPESDVLDINNIKVPGGFRRNYLRRVADSPSPAGRAMGGNGHGPGGNGQAKGNPRLLTNNFIEFLTLYGHFAGEELEEDDEVLGPDEYFSSDAFDESATAGGDDEDEESREYGEDSALMTPGRRRRKRKDRGGSGENTVSGAVLLLLKSFVGTGVLFLPKAYLNGGMLFSNIVLIVVALLSYWCFLLLVRSRNVVNGSFGDIGGILYGKKMRAIILFSIVLSQIGFASAYIVFTSQNLQAFILAVSNCRTFIDIKYMILMQLIIFLPLSLFRDISKLGATALVADVLILLGLIYLYWYDLFTIVKQQGVADIVNFNSRDWTLFIGTAIFTFEGVGLIIPIQESMKRPHLFPSTLGVVMIVIAIIFLSSGALGYAAYGSKTQTVIILNMPQDDKFVNAVQFMYSLAILLSTPLQLFPAIRITENSLFARSGKYNPYIKWKKNVFRFFLVMVCALIAWGGAGDLDKFVALVGSFACVPLVYVYPPLLHLKAVARTPFQRYSDIALCVFGIIVMVYTTTLTIKNWANGASAVTPGYCDG